MATVSAIPEHLYAYADHCTRGAEQLQTWVRAVLTPALRAYESGGGTSCSGLDSALAREIAAAFYTDRDVRTVGQAFMEVNGANVRKPTMPISVQEKSVNAVFQRLQAQYVNQARMDAGAALAKRMEKNPGSVNLKEITDELARHANDPYFNAGFFNGLERRQIERMMSDPTGIQALVSAFASGAVSKGTADSVAQGLGWLAVDTRFPVNVDHYFITPAEQTAFLKGLLANPAASAQFAYHMDDPEFRSLWDGSASQNPELRPLLMQILKTHPSWPPGDTPATPANLSWELRFANNLPYPSVAPHGVDRNGKPYSRDELAVLSWIEFHKDTILQEARARNIDPKAIVAAIAWEALHNKGNQAVRAFRGQLPAVPPLNYHQSMGPGKVHIDSEVAADVEGELLPRQGNLGRQDVLTTSDGSIRYIAAILAKYAAVTEDFQNRPSIRQNVPVLVNLYQGSDFDRWRSWLSNPRNRQYEALNEMGLWAQSPEGRRLLDDSLRLWGQP